MNITRKELKAVRDLLKLSTPSYRLVVCGGEEKPIAVCTGCGKSKPMGRMLFIKHTPNCLYEKYWSTRAVVEQIGPKKARVPKEEARCR